ncbi:MAG: hypothetical protein ACHQ2Y_08700 [Candidatus Lutacidiplasmatales archaeon]
MLSSGSVLWTAALTLTGLAILSPWAWLSLISVAGLVAAGVLYLRRAESLLTQYRSDLIEGTANSAPGDLRVETSRRRFEPMTRVGPGTRSPNARSRPPLRALAARYPASRERP